MPGKPVPVNRNDPAVHDMVRRMAAQGLTTDQIADCLGVSTAYVSRYFTKLIQTGRSKAIAKVAEKLYHKAVVEENLTAIIFYLKTQGHWRERDRLEIQGSIEHNHTHTGVLLLPEDKSVDEWVAARQAKTIEAEVLED